MEFSRRPLDRCVLFGSDTLLVGTFVDVFDFVSTLRLDRSSKYLICDDSKDIANLFLVYTWCI